MNIKVLDTNHDAAGASPAAECINCSQRFSTSQTHLATR